MDHNESYIMDTFDEALSVSQLDPEDTLILQAQKHCMWIMRKDMDVSGLLGAVRLLSRTESHLLSLLADACAEPPAEETESLCIPAVMLRRASIPLDKALTVQVEPGCIRITSSLDTEDPLDRYDEEFLDILSFAGVDLDRLRSLLMEEHDNG